MSVNEKFLLNTFEAARAAGHVFPAMAACEAAVESAWGQSKLFLEANNAFGVKQHQHPIFGTLSLPTKEFLHGQWVVVDAEWVKYPTLQDCFADRMQTLTRLQDEYPHYKAALTAPDPETYVTEVSKSWSTDPNRAATCILIYHAHGGILK